MPALKMTVIFKSQSWEFMPFPGYFSFLFFSPFVSLCLFLSRSGPVPQGGSGVGGGWRVPDEKDGLENGRGPRQEP